MPVSQTDFLKLSNESKLSYQYLLQLANLPILKPPEEQLQIDVFRYDVYQGNLENIISRWGELVAPEAVRFTGNNYFLQALVVKES